MNSRSENHLGKNKMASVKLTSDEQQFLIDMLKTTYDNLYRGQRNGDIDWVKAEITMNEIRKIEEKFFGHKIKRAGWEYL